MSRSLREIGNLQTSHAEEMHDVSSLPLRARTDPARSPPGARRVGLSSMLLLMIAAFGVGFGAGWGADKAAHAGLARWPHESNAILVSIRIVETNWQLHILHAQTCIHFASIRASGAGPMCAADI